MAEGTDFIEDATGNHWLRNIAAVSPPTVEVSLHTASPGESGSFANEVAGGGYTRQVASFAAPTTPGEFLTDADLVFTNMPAVTVSDWAIDDTVGNMLVYGTFTAPIVVLAGQTFRIVAGSLEVDIL